ncbi:MAG: hypothetical protein P8Y62_08255 [candidate division WOR-3 bacterium]|jgi:hypothetical protein
MQIKIESTEDIRTVIDEMHDSEFEEEDFGFDSKNETFFLRSYSSKGLNKKRKEFYLEIYNIKKYNILNLDKIKKGKATGGIFNTIDIGHTGLKLSIISQDLNIVLRLSKLKGILKIKNKK